MADSLLLDSPIWKETCHEIHKNWDRPSVLAKALASQSPRQLQEISTTYLSLYGKDLTEHLLGASQDDQENELLLAAYLGMLKPWQRDAVIARRSVEYIDNEFRGLVELYTSRKSNQLFLIRQEYQARFKTTLENDISSTSHPYQPILMALAASHNAHHTDTSQHIAKCDAKRLYEARNRAAAAIDEAVILEIFSKRSIPQLKLALSSYMHIYGHPYTKTLKNQKGEFAKSVRAVIKCMYNLPKYYAKMLFLSLKGMTRDKSALARILVSEGIIDVKEVIGEFERKYQIKLHEAITESIKNEDCKDFLISLTNMYPG